MDIVFASIHTKRVVHNQKMDSVFGVHTQKMDFVFWVHTQKMDFVFGGSTLHLLYYMQPELKHSN
jgi:hypothetical protein